MIFKKIRLKNIRSYKEEEIIFPEGAVLLAGDVGSGKSSVFLALEYALFGLQPGQRGSALLSNGEDYGEVSLEMDVDGANVIIERGLKRSSKSISQDFAAITINGARFESSVTEVKSKILELLNYPIDFIRKNNLVYKYTVYTPQEEMKQIIIENVDVRLDVLRHVFGIDKYKRIQENIQRLSTMIREESRILQAESASIDSRRNELDSSLKFIKILESKIIDKEKEIKSSKSEIELKEKELESLQKLVQERESFKTEIEKSSLMVRNKNEQISRFVKDLKEIEEILNSSKSSDVKRNIESLMGEISKIRSTIDILEKDYFNISSKSSSLDMLKQSEISKKNKIFQLDHCPTCLQDVPETHKHNIMNATESSIKSIDNNKQVLLIEIQKVESEIKKHKEKVKLLEQERIAIEIHNSKQENIVKYQSKKQDLTKLKESFEKDISLINEHIDSLKKNTFE